MNSQDSDYQIQQPKPQSRIVLAGGLEARSRDGKKWKMRRVELLGSGELLLRGKRNATRYLLDGRCTVSCVEAKVSDKGLHSLQRELARRRLHADAHPEPPPVEKEAG